MPEEPTPCTDKVTSQPGFQEAWNKACQAGMYSKYTQPADVVNAETNAVFLDRVEFFEFGARITALEAKVAELEAGALPEHRHLLANETGGVV